MTAISSLAKQLGLRASRDAASDMVVLSGERGTIVFNPRLRGILIGNQLHFRAHRVVIENGCVSVPPGFIGECEKRLKPAKPAKAGPKQPNGPPKPRFHVVLDPGHGGRDPGAIGVSGGYEKTVNLQVSHLIAAKLRAAGVQVTMTRTGDSFVDLNDRPAVGNRLSADVFVSIHADAATNRSARGFTVFVVHPKYSDASRALLVSDEYSLDVKRHNGGHPVSQGRRLQIVRSLLGQNRLLSARLAALVRCEMGKVTRSPDRGTQLGAFRVLRRSVCPAVLIELGFMSNPSEERRLHQPAHQRALAAAITNAIVAFLNPK